MFWHSLKDFKLGVAHPHSKIGTSPFLYHIKYVGGMVEWIGPEEN